MVSSEFQARSRTVGRWSFGPDPVEPVVSRDEVPAGIANDGHAHLPDLVDDVLAEAVRVGEGIAGVVDARIDGAAQVLEKRAEQAAIEIRAVVALIDDRARRAARLGVTESREPGRGCERSAGGAELGEEFAAIDRVRHGDGSPFGCFLVPVRIPRLPLRVEPGKRLGSSGAAV